MIKLGTLLSAYFMTFDTHFPDLCMQRYTHDEPCKVGVLRQFSDEKTTGFGKWLAHSCTAMAAWEAATLAPSDGRVCPGPPQTA